MTYCIGVMLDKGMTFASDSCTNAGVYSIAKFCKMTVFEHRGSIPSRSGIAPMLFFLFVERY